MTVLISLICAVLVLILFSGAFYVAKYIVEKQHRVHVLEDAYKEATDHIAQLQMEITSLNHQIEQMQYEAQLNGERMARPRHWNPSDPLNSEPRQ